MAKEYKFDRNFNKRPYKLNEAELSLTETIAKLEIEVEEVLEKGLNSLLFRYHTEYFLQSNTRFHPIIKDIKSILERNQIDTRMYPTIHFLLKEVSQKIEEGYSTKNGERSFVDNQYKIIRSLFDPLLSHVKDLYEKDREKEDDLKALSSTSKNFFQFNSFHAIFNEGYFGKNFTLAEKICDYLGLTEKIKERFYLEVIPVNDLPKPDDTPRNELKEALQNLNK